jgi:SET domain-containing protein
MYKTNLKVKHANTGLGLFTLEPISAKQRIIEFTGPIITTEERNKRGGKYLFEIDKHLAIDGKSLENLARYINHSCRPNSIAYLEDNQIWIWSRKQINAGEEITINYGKEYFNEFIRPISCKCENCASSNIK